MGGFHGSSSSGNESNLDLERLKEYEAAEAEQFDVYLKRLSKGELGPYPSPERFSHLTQPVARRAPDGSVWAQIPIYGSLVIPLLPVPESDFAKAYEFEISDLQRLVSLCKETGRVQFTLAARPTQFAGLDYLDPIFSELRPPVIRTIPNSAVFDDGSLKKGNLLFDTTANISLWPLVRTSLLNAGLDYRYADQTYETLRSSYVMLKLLGYNKAIEEIDESIIADPPRAYRVLYFYNQFVQGPIFDPLKEVASFSRDYIKEMKKIPESTEESETERFPCEVGAILLNSLVLAPESLDACMSVVDRYDDATIAKLVSNLNSAVIDSKSEVMKSASGELKDALQGIWEDAKSRPIPGVSHGISFELAAGGCAAAQLLSGTTEEAARLGLLSALGFRLTEKTAESAPDESSSRAISRSYAMSIYNFQKKRRLDRP